MLDRPVFPFSALVGQDAVKRGLILNAINPRLGGILIRGEKGTAKSTAVRAFARLLPPITVVRDCPFRCDPDGPVRCATCTARVAAGEALPRERRRVPLVDLPIGASEDRVVGTLNLEQAIREGERVFEPGLLAAAHRGILYVDEVNLLADHLVDVLLDAAAMGQNYVEREGVSVVHPAEFILIGTMNPEEGELRPQLLDRFALAVSVTGLADAVARAEVVRRRLAFEADPVGFRARWEEAETAERTRIIRAQALLPTVRITDEQLELIGRICAASAVDGLRGDIVLCKTALALAAYAGRQEVSIADLREAADLALTHRRRRQPFDDPTEDRARLDDLFREHGADPGGGATGEPAPAEPAEPAPPGAARGGAAPDPPSRTFAPGAVFPVRRLEPPRPRAGGDAPVGRRSVAPGQGRAGHDAGARLPTRDLTTLGDLALAATLRAAAPRQRARRGQQPGGPRLRIAPADLRERQREVRVGQLILFVVDASGSMAARQRMVAVKGAVLSLLLDAYQKRDRVALITCRGEAARLVLPPTTSVTLAERQVRQLPTGGRTPLAHALQLCAEMLQRSLAGPRREVPWLVLVSDGRPNVPLAGGDALADALRLAGRLRERGVRALVIECETGPVRLGQNRRLAAALGAEYLQLEALAAGTLAAAVRERLGRGTSGGPGGDGAWTR